MKQRHKFTVHPPRQKMSTRGPEVTVEPRRNPEADDEQNETVARRLKAEAAGIRRLWSEVLPRCADLAGPDLPKSRVRELAGDLLAAGPEDPMLAVTLRGTITRSHGRWISVYYTALTQAQAPANDRFCLDEHGEPLNENISVDLIVPARRARAIGELTSGDWRQFFRVPLMHGASKMDLLIKNAGYFRETGRWEEALIYAYTRERDRRPLSSLRWLLESADRARLLSCGDQLPGDGPFTLYRGVGDRRRLGGPSWTSDVKLAAIFAAQAPVPRRIPEVYTTTVAAANVFFYKAENEAVPLDPALADSGDAGNYYIGDHFLAIVDPENVERVDTDEVREFIREWHHAPESEKEMSRGAIDYLETVM